MKQLKISRVPRIKVADAIAQCNGAKGLAEYLGFHRNNLYPLIKYQVEFLPLRMTLLLLLEYPDIVHDWVEPEVIGMYQ